MLDAAYLKHLKAIGKFAYIHGQADADIDAMTLMASRMFDQVATGEVDTFDSVKLVNRYTNTIDGAINSGPVALKAAMEQVAGEYLVNILAPDLENEPEAQTPKAVLEALIQEMTDDSKTFTTAGGGGFVDFFEGVWAPSGAFPQDADPTYADSDYVKLAVA